MSTITSRLGGFFKRMQLSEPVRIDIRPKRANAEVQTVAKTLEIMAQPETAPQPQPRSSWLPQFPGARRDAAIEELRRGYGEVRELIKSMRNHMDTQSERGERLLDLLACMPDALRALPESNRNQVRMLEAIQSHLDQQSRSTHQFSSAIHSVAAAAQQQAQVLQAMQNQMEKQEQAREASAATLNKSFEKLNTSNDNTAETLLRVCNSRMRAEDRMEELMRQNNRYITLLTFVTCMLTLAAMGTAIYAVMKLSGNA